MTTLSMVSITDCQQMPNLFCAWKLSGLEEGQNKGKVHSVWRHNTRITVWNNEYYTISGTRIFANINFTHKTSTRTRTDKLRISDISMTLECQPSLGWSVLHMSPLASVLSSASCRQHFAAWSLPSWNTHCKSPLPMFSPVNRGT